MRSTLSPAWEGRSPGDGGPHPSFPEKRRFSPWSRFPSRWAPTRISRRGGSPGGGECSGKPRARLGKYAVTGNHEFYAGIDQALSFTRRAGFSVLRGETVTVGNILRIAGVDDLARGALGAGAGPPEDEGSGGEGR